MAKILPALFLLLALHVKVVDIKSMGRVRFHLPMHAAELITVLDDDEPNTGVKKGEFYRAHVKDQTLTVRIKKRWVRFHIKKVAFVVGH